MEKERARKSVGKTKKVPNVLTSNIVLFMIYTVLCIWLVSFPLHLSLSTFSWYLSFVIVLYVFTIFLLISFTFCTFDLYPPLGLYISWNLFDDICRPENPIFRPENPIFRPEIPILHAKWGLHLHFQSTKKFRTIIKVW